MSISMEDCYSRLDLVRFLSEAALFLSILVKWLLLPSYGWWSACRTSSELENAAAEARARHRAAAQGVRESLRVSTYGEVTGMEEAEKEETAAMCAVCLSEVARQDSVWELRNCMHVFHKGCLDRWLDHDEHLSCPLCRAPLLSQRPLPPPPPPPPADPSWAVERLLYLFGDDLPLASPS